MNAPGAVRVVVAEDEAIIRLDTKRLFAGLVLSSAGGIVFFNLIGLLERLTVRWPGGRLQES